MFPALLPTSPAPSTWPDAATAEPATIMLLATPPEAIEHAPAVYAAILRDASVSAAASDRPRCQVE